MISKNKPACCQVEKKEGENKVVYYLKKVFNFFFGCRCH